MLADARLDVVPRVNLHPRGINRGLGRGAPDEKNKKKAERLKALADDRAASEAENKKELARWTPELHAEAPRLVGLTDEVVVR